MCTLRYMKLSLTAVQRQRTKVLTFSTDLSCWIPIPKESEELFNIFQMPGVTSVTAYQRVIALSMILNGLQVSLCIILIRCAARSSVVLPAGRWHQPFPESACAWLHLLGVTTRVRGQFGASRGSSVLSNITAGTSSLDPASIPATGTPQPR